jgi:hypothetical protein
MNSSVQKHINTLEDLLSRLRSLKNNRVPTQEINDLNSEIIQLMDNKIGLNFEEEKYIYNHFAQEQEEFQDLCQRLVYTCELVTVQQFISEQQSKDQDVLNFYKDLIKGQIDITDRIINGKTLKTSLFMGIGPWPISAVLLAKHYKDLRIDLLDYSLEATEYAKQFIAVLQSENIHVLPAQKAQDFNRINEYDIVWIASMVGRSREDKISIYQTIAQNTAPGKILITRSCRPESIFSLIDVPFPYEELNDLYELVEPIEFTSNSNLTNVILRRKP